MDKRSAVLGAAGTLIMFGIAGGLIATANAQTAAPQPVVTSVTATPTPEIVVTTPPATPAPAPVAEPVVVAPAPVEPAPVVVEPAPVYVPPAPVYVAPDPVVPVPAATLPNGMTTVQVPGGPPPVKMGISVDPGDGSKGILAPTLQDVGPAPRPIAGK